MDARITEFSEVLRQNGLKVGVNETADAARAVAEVGVADRAVFRAALQATMCKRLQDVETFDRAFDFYFSGAAKTLEALDRSLAARISEEGLLEGDELKMIVAWLDQMRLSALTQAAVQGDTALLANLMRNAALQLDFSRMQTPLQGGFFSRRMMVGAGVEGMRSDLAAIAGELRARGVSERSVEVVARELSDALRRVEEAARQEVERQTRARLRKPSGGLSDRPFHTLSRAEVERMQRAVRAMAEKLKARLVRKHRSKRRGTLNPIRTLRKNLSAGGVPMQPVFRLRRPERPDVMVLCDISDSVRNASRMMLLFTWALQSLFARVRSFVFVSEIGEVTELFKDAEPEAAIDAAVTGKTISTASNSNYGHALKTFARDWLGSVSRRTTVLVIGDGRNNYNAPNVWALEDLKRKARRLVWISTEPKTSWGFGDSQMLQYAKACSQVVTVQTLADLETVAAQLVPK